MVYMWEVCEDVRVMMDAVLLVCSSWRQILIIPVCTWSLLDEETCYRI